MKHGDANSQGTHNDCPVMTTSPILHKTNATSDLDPLDVITPQFFIPGLENRPYDPIVEALENIRVKPIGTLNTSKIKQRSLSGNSFTSVVKERRVGLEIEEECGDVWTLPEVIAPSKVSYPGFFPLQYTITEAYWRISCRLGMTFNIQVIQSRVPLRFSLNSLAMSSMLLDISSLRASPLKNASVLVNRSSS